MLNVMVVQNRKPEPQQMLEPIKQHIKKIVKYSITIFNRIIVFGVTF